MIRVGKPLRPTKAQVGNGGDFTTFTVPEKHMTADGVWVDDGLVGVKAPGTYDFKIGDVLVVEKVAGWTKRKASTGTVYFTIIASKVHIVPKKDADLLTNPMSETLLNDIPEEML